MKLTLATSVLIALANAVAVPGATRKVTRIPVPEGYFESHLGSVGFTVTPAEQRSPKLAARALTHFYACVDSDFRGKCESFTINTGECYSFNSDWNDAITSIGPDKGTTCTIWYDWKCAGRTVDNIKDPGIYNLGDFNFNDAASSIKCE
ncbi:hypothetical protein VE03_05139 [Pseudogymnoascus sp. 23342-1-I1]|nr:hypothetical protein VE03_05139 [Pseudogymnoascus sp. 23342-1-I1]